MNAVLMTVYDQTGLQTPITKDAYNSLLAQDIPVEIHVIDNGSTSIDTLKWLKDIPNVIRVPINRSPLGLMNSALKTLFIKHDHVLGVPNDIIAPPNLYRRLLEWPHGIVTPGMHGENPPVVMDDITRIHGDVHLSAALIRESAYDVLLAQDGYFFDEGFFMYASDCDLKVRLAKAQVPTAQLDLLCWHYGGASHRLALRAQDVYKQADTDREYFLKKWGFAIGSPEFTAWIEKL